MRARHRVAKLLLRHDLRFEGNNWTQRHLDWLGRVELPEPVAQSVLLDGIGAIDALLVRRESLETQMASLVAGSPWERQVAHLRCLRGIDTLSALGQCAEVGDFERFARPAQTGCDWTPSGASAAPSARSPWPGSWQASAGR